MKSYRLTGQFTLNLAPDEAFHLFTPRGERAWAPGWEPVFPVPTDDDSAPGTVFETSAHGVRTIWIVAESAPPHRISYAQIRPEERAGTVAVTLAEAAGGSEVTVTYHLTPLTDSAQAGLDQFAAGYPGFLAGWPAAMATHLAAQS